MTIVYVRTGLIQVYSYHFFFLCLAKNKRVQCVGTLSVKPAHSLRLFDCCLYAINFSNFIISFALTTNISLCTRVSDDDSSHLKQNFIDTV